MAVGQLGEKVQKIGFKNAIETLSDNFSYLLKVLKDAPILLLDDVLSELDDSRQTHLLSTIQHKVQTFVTTTSVDGIDHEIMNNAKLYRINQGEIIK